ncbi:PHD finger protein At3g20280 [Eutrema salsugineum]|uniref:PHD finger protein At3g20280 n=1 Tax=Eutrema salsugineum TaxID=72664 RepID=UPI000CED5A25|nr:PHD finger protein At3g20280 [Eutrema salsugineum]XP_024006032.1 PHD finger protein At3g20280 [Eutrema salsugineum]
MDVEIGDVPVNLESVVKASVVEEKNENGEAESVAPPSKKPRFDEEVNRVAEIVLVLSALRRIRGGKSPTDLEQELMVEAKSKLVDMCQEFAPKDIIGRDAIGAVIEDLGLNGKLKDQRLGFRAPKLTISEKLSLGKRKMEESKKHPVVSTTHTSPGVLTSANNVSMAHHQWPNSEMKSSISAVNATGSHFVRDASGITQTRIERPQFKSDMHTGASQGPVPAGNYFGNTTSWSAQPPSSSTISFGTPSESKVHVPSSSRVTDPSFRPFMSHTQTGTFPGMKGVTYGQTSSPFGNNHHAEIAKLIHKVLQPRAKQNLLWNPPSREYMSKAMTCQMCQGTINEVETVLICDACEKGYHLKCLQANNMKGIPKSEWHCSRCVQFYNGKPFPPKYGRVMRSATTAKMSSTTAEVQLPAEKKVGKINLKVNQQQAMPHPGTAKPTENSTGDQTVEAKDAAARAQTVEAEDAAATRQTVEAENAAAIGQTVEAQDAAAMRQTVEAQDAAAIGQTVEAEDAAATCQTVEAQDAAATRQTDEAEDAAAIGQTVEAEDAAATSQKVKADNAAAISQTAEAEDAAATNQTVEAEDAAATSQMVEAEDASMSRAVDTNNESQGYVGNDAECDDPSEPVSHSDTLNPPKLENKEDPSKDVIEGSVSTNCQDEDPKIVTEPTLQEESSASQTENLPSHTPLQSNTEHSQQQSTQPNVEGA